MTTKESDRELLELAAKAAGIPVQVSSFLEREGLSHAGSVTPWNPLTDDGDAFRLAVKLGIDLTLHGAKFVSNYVIAEIDPGYAIHGENYFTEDGIDSLASTRRAIVRAAAALTQGA